MRKDEGYHDALRREVMDAQNETDFFIEGHTPASEKLRGDDAYLYSIDRSERNAVEECGGHERFRGQILVRIALAFGADHQARDENDRENPEDGLNGRRNGPSEIPETLQEIERKENDRDPEGRFHSNRKGDVRFGYGGGIEFSHSENFVNHIRKPRHRNRSCVQREKDLIFNGYSAESPTRSRISTDRIWPSEG